MSETYTNELENAFNSFPGWLQAPLRPIFNAMTEGLRWVAGDPQALVAAGALYVSLGQRIQDQAQQQLADRGHWQGDAYQAFLGKMADVEAKIGTLAQATSKTQDVLNSAAEIAVEAATSPTPSSTSTTCSRRWSATPTVPSYRQALSLYAKAATGWARLVSAGTSTIWAISPRHCGNPTEGS